MTARREDVLVAVAPQLHKLAATRLAELFATEPVILEGDAPPAASRARAIAASHVAIGAREMDAFPQLEIIANFGVGYDLIDVAEARRRGIAVTNTPDVLTDDVADLAVGLLVGTVRRLAAADRYLRRGDWAAKGAFPLTGSCTGGTAGILGLGRIGMAIAARLAPMKVGVHYHARRPRVDVPYPFHADAVSLARASDFLIVCCPGGEATRNLVDRAVLEALGPDGVLINVARGSVVDEAALIAALRDGRIRGAGLDVYVAEPGVPPELVARDDVFLLPHVGSATVPTRDAMANLVVDNLVAHFAGLPPLTPVR